MSKVTIFKPLNKPLRGTLLVPGDKSISQRAIFLSAMASGTSHIYDAACSKDVKSAVDVMKTLGADINVTKSKHSNESNIDIEIDGWGEEGPISTDEILDCGNSATCARVGMGVLTGYNVEGIFDGDESLHHRPFMRVIDPLLQMGANFHVIKAPDGKPQRSTLPCLMHGTDNPSPIDYDMPVASSQVKAAILFAGLNADGDTTVAEPYASRNHTELLLQDFGADLDYDPEMLTTILHGPCKLSAHDVYVPGDMSSAAYFITAACLVPGSKITIKNVGLNETRMGFIRVLQNMGARIKIERQDFEQKGANYGREPVGNITAQYGGRLEGTEISADLIPQLVDEVPILALAAACAEGDSTFFGVKELKLKECNRIQAIAQTLKKLGADARDEGNNLHVTGGIDIEGKETLIPTEDELIHLDNFGDHRLAIVCALAGICGFKPVEMENFEVSQISYPNFLDNLNKLVK